MKSKELFKSCTIEEKVDLTSGHDMWNFLGNERLGIKPIFVADGPHGVRVYKEMEDDHALAEYNLAESTMFPIAAAMSSTFNPELIQRVGKAIGEECNSFGVDILLGPGINLKRSPLGGRNFEYYSEDPYLTQEIAKGFVTGVQSQKVGTCIKHFALNEQESQRRFINSIVDEITFHELYLRPFKNVIDECNPFAVMSSYNKINGHYAGESKELLLDILRDKWNYKGAVISDWGGVQNKVKSIKTGMNIEMPGNSEFNHLMFEALENGTLTEEDIDLSLNPLYELRDRISLNDSKGKECDFLSHHSIAQSVAEEAIVLLENDGILPLDKGLKLGVIGDFAKTPRINGGGSATLKPIVLEIPLDELENTFEVSYAKGYEEENTNEDLLNEVRNVCENNDIIIYFTGTTVSLETEGADRPHMDLPKGHVEVFNQIAASGKKVIVVLNNGSAINVTPLQGKVNAIVESWLLGEANAKALVKVLTGDINPSGRLSETFPKCIENTPFYGQFPAWTNDVYYHGDLINVGYRYYDTHKLDVRYPFGYGLSYSNFVYENIKVDKSSFTKDETVKVTVTITNRSDVTGKETVQLYVKDVESYYDRPEKELKAFKKIELQPNETKEVEFHLTEDAFSVYAVDYKDFLVEGGTFEILVGKNVRDIELKEIIEYETDTPIVNSLTLKHPLINFFKFKPESVEYLVEKYRSFPWYEIEEPALRVLNRVKKQFEITDEDFQAILDKMMK